MSMMMIIREKILFYFLNVNIQQSFVRSEIFILNQKTNFVEKFKFINKQCNKDIKFHVKNTLN